MAETVRLLPDADQFEILRSTLQRVNRVCNVARTAALERGVSAGADLRAVVRDAADRFKLPAALVTPARERVREALTGPAGKRQKFGEYQSLTLPAGAVKWPATDRVALPTGAGKRTVRVYVDPSKGGLRPPLEGRPVSLVFRNGEFELVAADT